MNKHITEVYANGTSIVERVNTTTIGGPITWQRISAGLYRGTHPLFAPGLTHAMAYVRPLAIGGECFIDAVEYTEGGAHSLDISVMDAEGLPCDEFVARLIVHMP